MKSIKLGDSINFRMDGRWDSKGIVLGVYPITKMVLVKTTAPCKEFNKGSRILIDTAEITD